MDNTLNHTFVEHYSTPKGRIVTLHNNTVLYAEWIGYQTKESIFEMGKAILRIAKEQNIKLLLNDNTRVKGVWTWDDVLLWISEKWFPELAEIVSSMAWVYSKNAWANKEIKRVKDCVLLNGTKIKSFKSYTDAEEWVLSQQYSSDDY